jgi:hypothetical protein
LDEEAKLQETKDSKKRKKRRRRQPPVTISEFVELASSDDLEDDVTSLSATEETKEPEVDDFEPAMQTEQASSSISLKLSRHPEEKTLDELALPYLRLSGSTPASVLHHFLEIKLDSIVPVTTTDSSGTNLKSTARLDTYATSDSPLHLFYRTCQRTKKPK